MIITILIISLTAIVSITAFRNHNLFARFRFNANLIHDNKEYSRFFTYGLLHADWGHLFINMFVLFSFGNNVETIFTAHFGDIGRFYFLLLYVTALFASTLPSYFKHRNNYYYNAVGASGSVSAVLFSSIIIFPQGSIFLFLIPIPIPAIVFGILYLVYSAYMARRGSDNVGHDAHFWGAVFGILFTIALDLDFLFNFINYLLG
jgi:membrane associated rhomboid family serine protease